MHFQPCSGFIEQAPGRANGMSLDMAGDLDEFSGEDYRRWMFKGGGGVRGLVTSVVIGAVVGAITGGIGFLAMPALGLEVAAGATFWGAVASGAVMGGIGGSLIGAVAMMEARQ